MIVYSMIMYSIKKLDYAIQCCARPRSDNWAENIFSSDNNIFSTDFLKL